MDVDSVDVANPPPIEEIDDPYYVGAGCEDRVVVRRVSGSEKTDLGSDPMNLDIGSVGIIDPAFSFCGGIHWDHKSEPNFCRQIR